jgi:hypothetical protein
MLENLESFPCKTVALKGKLKAKIGKMRQSAGKTSKALIVML